VSGRFVGIDVGARLLHCATLEQDGRILDSAVLAADDRARLRAWCADAAVVAVDAPESPSSAPHAGDAALSPKFRAARCAEIELGRRHGCWVPWVAPRAAPFPAWMESGFAVYEALGGEGGPPVIEVYPYAGFRTIAGERLPRKQSAAGRQARAELLARAGVIDERRTARSHDALDALMAALVARDCGAGRARAVSCGHDGSAIWLPAPLP
jgi:predicted nuclease with RNAse H fold